MPFGKVPTMSSKLRTWLNFIPYFCNCRSHGREAVREFVQPIQNDAGETRRCLQEVSCGHTQTHQWNSWRKRYNNWPWYRPLCYHLQGHKVFRKSLLQCQIYWYLSSLFRTLLFSVVIKFKRDSWRCRQWYFFPGTRFLTGDTLCCFDCELMPKLQHIRVAGRFFLDFDIPSEMTHLWKYIREMYELDAFVQSCPADQVLHEFPLVFQHFITMAAKVNS